MFAFRSSIVVLAVGVAFTAVSGVVAQEVCNGNVTMFDACLSRLQDQRTILCDPLRKDPTAASKWFACVCNNARETVDCYRACTNLVDQRTAQYIYQRSVCSEAALAGENVTDITAVNGTGPAVPITNSTTNIMLNSTTNVFVNRTVVSANSTDSVSTNTTTTTLSTTRTTTVSSTTAKATTKAANNTQVVVTSARDTAANTVKSSASKLTKAVAAGAAIGAGLFLE